MLPALSAIDHAWADLDVDPGEPGSATFDSTDFLIYGRVPDTTAALFLWQINAIGETCETGAVRHSGLAALRDVLMESYPADHGVFVYEAARFVLTAASIVRLPLSELAEAKVSGFSMLYVPPHRALEIRPDRLAMLGLRSDVVRRNNTDRAPTEFS